MRIKYNPKLKEYSRELRTNQTDAEKKLWSKLRKNQIKNYRFTRQKPIGYFIADFYCHRLKLVIEVDGDRHYTEESKRYDKMRNEYLKKQGLVVYRINNVDIYKDIAMVIDGIYQKMGELEKKNNLV